MKKYFIQTALAVIACCARGQGTLQYDQESATSDSGGNGTVAPIQSSQPFGQSFIPSLSYVGFISLYVGDPVVPSGVGSTVAIDLWSGSLSTGTLLGTSESVYTASGAAGYENFYFSTPATVTPGTTYYFQPIVESGDASDVGVILGSPYSNGAEFINGVAQPAYDLWFREGIVVPEPSSVMLAVLAAGGMYFYRRTKP